MSVADKIASLKASLPSGVTLVAVSKTYPPSAIMEAYEAGQRVFGENRPQELAAKQAELPGDIEWHLIGGLQTNKVKLVAPFVSMIHSAESARLLRFIDREARRNDRVIDVLLEVRIARREQARLGRGRAGALFALRRAPLVGGRALPRADGRGDQYGRERDRACGIYASSRLVRPVERRIFRRTVRHAVDGHVGRLSSGRRMRQHDGPHRQRDIRREAVLKPIVSAIPPGRSRKLVS